MATQIAHAPSGTITLRPGTPEDTGPVCLLFVSQLLREPNLHTVEEALAGAPSVLAFDGDKLVGFVYCGTWAPDVMELLNVLVADTHRSKGLGTSMLRAVESLMPAEVRAIMLQNSDLYGTPQGKRPATYFYAMNEYSLIADTGDTRIFWKSLARRC